ncbi:hypothetical protein D3C76_1505190 [compost metagenome]
MQIRCYTFLSSHAPSTAGQFPIALAILLYEHAIIMYTTIRELELDPFLNQIFIFHVPVLEQRTEPR